MEFDLIYFTSNKHSKHYSLRSCSLILYALMKTTKLCSHFIATITLKHTLCH